MPTQSLPCSNPKSRSKSRSPLPPSNYKLSLSPRPFLPPSHYAAAVGISYVDRSVKNHGSCEQAKTPIENYDEPGENYTTAFMPVGYPSDAEISSDPGELNTPPASRRLPGEEKHVGHRRRRQSLISDLPQLEANLLPSLRDTITRMTQSPGPSTSSGNSTHLGVPKPARSRSLSPSATSMDNCTTPHFDKYPTSTSRPSCSDQCVPEDMDILTPRTNLPVKPSLKSALRPPTPKMFSKAFNDPPAGAATKSVRNILKQAGIATHSGTENQRPNTNSIDPPQRSRSRPDPGSAPLVSFAHLGLLRPRSPQGVPGSREPHHAQISSIPLPPGQWSTTDESDLENQYEAAKRSHRDASAAVFSSGSESDIESDREEERKRGRTREARKELRNSSEDAQGVGLGIGFDSASRKGRNSSASRTDAAIPHRRDRPPRSVRFNGGSQPPSYSERRSAKDKVDRNPIDPEDLSREHQRRRAALLGVFSRFDMDNHQTAVVKDSDADYDHGAVTHTRDHPEQRGRLNPNPQRLHNCEDHSESEDQASQPAPHTRRDRRRSASCTPTPTFLVSSIDHDRQLTRQPSQPGLALHPERYPGPFPNPPKHDKYRKAFPADPAVVHQHSVYHRPTSPPPPIEPDKRAGDQRSSGTKNSSKPSKSHRDSGAQKRDTEDTDSHPSVAVARERKAYGIPPPISDEEFPVLNRALPHVDSDSSVGSTYWDDDDTKESSLSPAAETLFRTLSGRQSKVERRSYSSNGEKSLWPGTGSMAPNPSYAVQPTEEHRKPHAPSPSSRRDDRRARSQIPRPSPPAQYVDAMEDRRVKLETQRQELITKIYQAEDAFVKRLQVFVQHFILPLRVQNSKDWISGVPTEVAHLFDWLEDIVVLHTQILSSLEATCSVQHPTVERIAESIRAYIPRLEVYQPYLVKLMDVVILIDQLMQDEQSDFGEYVRLQEAAPECDGWKFQNFLVEPVNALAKFPEFFSSLLELTPKDHSDYLSTFALVHSTDMFIRVMTEVKIREDEYDMIQRFVGRIQGLPPSARLATRERRLLHQGILHLTDVEKAVYGPSTSSNISRYFPTGMAPADTSNSANKTGRKPASALSKQETGIECARSRSASSPTTGASLKPVKSAPSSGGSSSATSSFFSSFRISLPQGRLNQGRQVSVKSLNLPQPLAPTIHSHSGDTNINTLSSIGTPVQAFVFTDFLLLAALTTQPDGWMLLKHIGTLRVIGVSQPQEQDSHTLNQEFITLEVLSLDAQKLNQPTSVDDGSVYLLRLFVPKDTSDNASPATESHSCGSMSEAHVYSWLTALRRCHKHTTCSLAIPSNSKQYDPQLDVAFDKHQAVYALLASGLPLPKSPSLQMADILSMRRGGGGEEDATTLERQERGWWSLRFQQVFREIQRQDMALGSVSDG